jgi:hypothetical protein
MKKFIIAMLMVFGLAACNKPYEENYPELLLDRYNITLKADGGSVQMMVYYSDAWTAEVTGVNTDWIILSRTGAPGQAYIRITYDSAIDVERTAYVTFYPAHGEPVELKLLQKAK